ncbi:hypothetical protein ABIB51_004540 [Arthrobacter sp. UYCu712]
MPLTSLLATRLKSDRQHRVPENDRLTDTLAHRIRWLSCLEF